MIQDFATRFIRQRGGGLTLLREYLLEQQHDATANERNHSTTTQGRSDDRNDGTLILHIATTRCRNLQGRIFSFDCSNNNLLLDQKDHLLRCVEASCRIPSLFHPYDILSPPASYPEHEGVVIVADNNNEDAYVDGGIAFPAPPIPPLLSSSGFNNNTGTVHCQRLIVSPLSGSSSEGESVHRISPDTKPRLFQMTLPDNMGVHLSRSNLWAVLRGATGLASSDELQDWYHRGQQDAEAWWRQTEKQEPHKQQ